MNFNRIDEIFEGLPNLRRSELFAKDRGKRHDRSSEKLNAECKESNVSDILLNDSPMRGNTASEDPESTGRKKNLFKKENWVRLE